MRLEPLFPALATLSLALAGVIDPSIPSAGDLFAGIDHFLHHTPSHPQLLEVHNDYFDITTGKKRKLCVLHPRGDGKHDDQNFKAAVHECGKGGIIRLPDANYTIGNPLVTELHDSVLDLHGWLSFSADIDHWVKHRMPFEFQNLALAWIIKGENYVLDGNDIGGIHGNGQAWDSWAKDESNKYGRPMSFAIVESKNVVVKNWSVIQPQFWASIIIRSENVLYKAYYVNATQHDPGARRHFLSWLQNTDGCDTYKSHNVTFENMVYQGGDNCLALKPNSSMIIAKNVTCFGGTGIAFGSIGQYRDVLDFIEDVQMEDITLLPSTQHLMTNGLYFKSWLGYPIGEPPNGGGGGAGYARNIKIWNVKMEKINRPVFLQSNLIYLEEHRGEGRDTGLFHWYDIHMSNITGTSSDNRVVWMDCSKKTPCHDITFENFRVSPGKDNDPEIQYVCNNIVLGGMDGLNACHPSESKHESWERQGNNDGPQHP